MARCYRPAGAAERPERTSRGIAPGSRGGVGRPCSSIPLASSCGTSSLPTGKPSSPIRPIGATGAFTALAMRTTGTRRNCSTSSCRGRRQRHAWIANSGYSNGARHGCAGLRRTGAEEGTAILGIELTPGDWGRYRLAVEVASALLEHGFQTLGLRAIIGRSASGNKRVERLARWFGAEVVACREGPDWMAAKGWSEVDWALFRDDWARSDRKRGRSSR